MKTFLAGLIVMIIIIILIIMMHHDGDHIPYDAVMTMTRLTMIIAMTKKTSMEFFVMQMMIMILVMNQYY